MYDFLMDWGKKRREIYRMQAEHWNRRIRTQRRQRRLQPSERALRLFIGRQLYSLAFILSYPRAAVRNMQTTYMPTACRRHGDGKATV